MRSWLISGLILAAVTAAQPAAARVHAPGGALSASEARTLEATLGRQKVGHFELVFVDSAPGGAVGMAEREFRTRRLRPDQAMIVVALGDRQVGVHVGGGFSDVGVDTDTINARVKDTFAPRARQGDFTGAAVALAASLERLRQDPLRKAARNVPALEAYLKSRGLDRYAIAFEKGNYAPDRARTLFDRQQMRPQEGLVVVFPEARRVAAAVGADFLLSDEAATHMADRLFTSFVNKWEARDAIYAAVYGLELERREPIREAARHPERLTHALARQGTGHFRVVFVDASADLQAEARASLHDRLSYPYEAEIRVTYEDPLRVGVALGSGFKSTEAQITDLIDQVFMPLARPGRIEAAVSALAARLDALRQVAVPTVAPFEAALQRQSEWQKRLDAKWPGAYVLRFEPAASKAADAIPLGPDAVASLLVTEADRRLTVHLAERFAMPEGQAEALVASAFLPRARQGDYEGGVMAVVEGLEAHRGVLKKRQDEHNLRTGGFVALLVGVPLGWVAWRQRRRREGLSVRMMHLVEGHQRIMSLLVELDSQAAMAAEDAVGETRQLLAELVELNGRLLVEGPELGRAIEASTRDLAMWRLNRVEQALGSLEGRAFLIEAAAAAARTAYIRLDKETRAVATEVTTAEQHAQKWIRSGSGRHGRQLEVQELIQHARQLAEQGDPAGAMERVYDVMRMIAPKNEREALEPPATRLVHEARRAAETWQELQAKCVAVKARAATVNNLDLAEQRLEDAHVMLTRVPVRVRAATHVLVGVDKLSRKWLDAVTLTRTVPAASPQAEPSGAWTAVTYEATERVRERPSTSAPSTSTAGKPGASTASSDSVGATASGSWDSPSSEPTSASSGGGSWDASSSESSGGGSWDTSSGSSGGGSWDDDQNSSSSGASGGGSW